MAEDKEISGQRYEEARELQKTDPVRAFGMFQELAEQQDSYAMLQLAWAYWHGQGTPIDKAAATQWYRRAQVCGNRDVQQSGRLGEAQLLQVTDPVRAFGIFQELAEQGEPYAMLHLAGACWQGQGTPVDKVAAAQWYRRAHASDNPDLQRRARLGEARLMHATDPAQAFGIFERLAEQQEYEAMLHLAQAYWQGQGTPVDKAAAAQWYRRAQASDNPDLQRRARLGEAQLLQATDPVRAFGVVQELARQDMLDAIVLLAQAYETGVGTPVDKAAATQWYRRAYDVGPPAMKQQITRREAYELREKDPVRALGMFHELAEQDDSYAMLRLAWAYWQGQGTPIDKAAAEHWYRRACESNEETVKRQANYYCGVLLEEQQRYAEAYEMFSSGAALEYAPALLRLGRLYLKGRGVSRDRNRAITLYEQAAARGNLVAKSSLGFQWMRGRCGLKKIIPGARLWMQAVGEIAAVCKKAGRSDERVFP
ncbi:MAG: SEL1-like repeat protein [Acidiferrobacter sp.]